MSENFKLKLKSKVVWATAIPIIANLIAQWTVLTTPEQRFSAIATTIVTILAIFGILNNPNSTDSF